MLKLVSLSVVGVLATASDNELGTVISLLESMKKTSEDEFTAMKSGYEKISCDCEDYSTKKSKAIVDGQSTVADEAATVKAQHEEMLSEAAEEAKQAGIQKKKTEDREKATVTWNALDAKLQKTIADLLSAETALKKAKLAVEGGRPESLLSTRSTIKKSILMAEMFGMDHSVVRAGKAFLELGEPDHYNKGDFEHKTGAIITMLTELHDDFKKQYEDTVAERTREQNAFNTMDEALKKEIDGAKTAKEQAKSAKVKAEENKGEAMEAMTEAAEEVKLAKEVLTDSTAACEAQAKLYDQQFAGFTNEIKMLEGVIEVMEGVTSKASRSSSLISKRSVVTKRAALSDDDASVFLQERASVKKVAAMVRQGNGKMQRVQAELMKRATTLGSARLQNLAAEMMKDGPFDKVTKLINELIQRLLKEAAAEASKNGYCDAQLAKAHTNRKFTFENIHKLNTQMEKDEAYIAELKVRLDELKSGADEPEGLIPDEEAALDKEIKTYESEKKRLTEDLGVAHENEKALAKAIGMVKDFYKGENNSGGQQAALLQQPSSKVLDEADTGDMMTVGDTYKGQSNANELIASLENLKQTYANEFDMLKKTLKEKKEAHIKYSRELEVSISKLQTEFDHKKADFEAAEVKYTKDLQELENLQNKLDQYLKTLASLNEECVDTGLSAAEVQAKIKAEIDALNNALEALGGDKVSVL